jgi:phage baseplate assembly protein W
MGRADYDYPFRIDAGSGQAGTTGYPAHVDQMLRQLLLTSPGERTCLPDFGCGLLQLLFAPQSDALAASVTIMVRQSIERWLADQVKLVDVSVTAGAGSDPALGLDEGTLAVTVSYVLIDTQQPATLTLTVGVGLAGAGQAGGTQP